MNVGDRVRLLHGKEEGVIVRILQGDLIEVEIEEGFAIPVMKKEAVVIAKEESKSFERSQESKTGKPAREVIGEKGLFFAFVEVNDRELALYLINNTDYDALFSFSEEAREKIYGLSNGTLNPRSAIKLKTYLYNQLENWPAFIAQIIVHRAGYFSLKQPLTKSLRVKAASFVKRKGQAPVLDRSAYIFQIDDQDPKVELDPVKLKESLLKGSSPSLSHSESPPQSLVDLHIERLVKNSEGLTGGQILELQLEAFERALDKAIEKGLDEIMFIHGVGAGVLRQAIHKRLSERKNIVFFKDAMKEKFGYGATTVKIK